MRPKELSSSYDCDTCGETVDDDDSEHELFCDRKKDSSSDMCKEIKQLKHELKTDKEHSRSEIQRLTDIIATIKLELSDANKQLKSLRTNSVNTATLLEFVKEDVESIKKDGIPLNKDNIRFIKKTARKIAIREIVEWESD